MLCLNKGSIIMDLYDFLKTFALFLAIDVTYLIIIFGAYYRNYFAKYGGFGPQTTWYGLCAWVLLAFGINQFVLKNSTTPNDALINGAIFGLVVYGVYDFTNLATISTWTTEFAITDMMWGTVICAVVSYLRKIM